MARRKLTVGQRRLLTVADFIEKLKPRKLRMEYLADLKGAGRMDPFECNSSVACVMGWLPAIFPRIFKWVVRPGSVSIALRERPLMSYSAGGMFGISGGDAVYLFGLGTKRYHTPKQVAEGIREYVRTGSVPRQCFPARYMYREYLREKRLEGL